MKNSKGVIVVFVAVVILSISPSTTQADDLLYETNNGTITVTGYVGPGGMVEVPSQVGGLPVTTIGQMAFRDCSTVTRVHLPEGVATISDWAFWNCHQLQDVELPQGLTTIGGYAFQGCIRMASFVIPKQVSTIAPGTFGDCIGLTVVSVPDGVASIGEGAFAGTGITSIALPDSVYELGDRVFWSCTNLSSVTLSGGLAKIGWMAFYNCSALSHLTIPSGVNSIQDKAFEDCGSLAAVHFKGNAPLVEPGAFANASLATLYWLPGTAGWTESLGGRPTTPWVLPQPVILDFPPTFGLQNNGFGFRISWATNVTVVVEAGTSLSTASWLPVSTNTLVNGWSDFRDRDLADKSARFYRIRSF